MYFIVWGLQNVNSQDFLFLFNSLIVCGGFYQVSFCSTCSMLVFECMKFFCTMDPRKKDNRKQRRARKKVRNITTAWETYDSYTYTFIQATCQCSFKTFCHLLVFQLSNVLNIFKQITKTKFDFWFDFSTTVTFSAGSLAHSLAYSVWILDNREQAFEHNTHMQIYWVRGIQYSTIGMSISVLVRKYSLIQNRDSLAMNYFE